MDPRFVTKTMHAYLDYPVAISLVALPFILGLGTSNPLAEWLAIVTGVAAFILTLFTDHKLGVIRILPYSFHLTVDFLVGGIFLIAPLALGFSGLDASTIGSMARQCCWSPVYISQKPRGCRWHTLEVSAA